MTSRYLVEESGDDVLEGRATARVVLPTRFHQRQYIIQRQRARGEEERRRGEEEREKGEGEG